MLVHHQRRSQGFSVEIWTGREKPWKEVGSSHQSQRVTLKLYLKNRDLTATACQNVVCMETQINISSTDEWSETELQILPFGSEIGHGFAVWPGYGMAVGEIVKGSVFSETCSSLFHDWAFNLQAKKRKREQPNKSQNENLYKLEI